MTQDIIKTEAEKRYPYHSEYGLPNAKQDKKRAIFTAGATFRDEMDRWVKCTALPNDEEAYMIQDEQGGRSIGMYSKSAKKWLPLLNLDGAGLFKPMRYCPLPSPPQI